MLYLDWQLTSGRFAIHVPTATAVAADLHLGYQDARQQCGDAIPSVDMEAQLAPLMRTLVDCKAKRLVIAGDLFESAFDPKIWRAFDTQLSRTETQFLGLIPGNHDRGLAKVPSDLAILSEGLEIGKWRILHGDGPLPKTPVVLGHFHPCVFRSGRKIPCYLAGEQCLVLPAYSKEAAGVVPDKRWQGFRRIACE
jgi:putative SbcD/Mre11-related phosphoesterase